MHAAFNPHLGLRTSHGGVRFVQHLVLTWSAGIARFDDLVDEILLEILKQCDGKSIAKLQCANRRMLLLGNLGTVWKESLLNHYGLHVPDAMGTSYTIFRDIYRWPHLRWSHSFMSIFDAEIDLESLWIQFESSQVCQHFSTVWLACRELIDEDQIDTRLPFRGLQTDGGMCKGDGSYWVDNMFHHNVRSHYRSRWDRTKIIHREKRHMCMNELIDVIGPIDMYKDDYTSWLLASVFLD